MKTLNFVPIIVLLIGLMLSPGCGDSPAGPDQEKKEEIQWTNPPGQLVGIWLFTAAYIDGAPSSLASALDWVSGSKYAAIEIENDGTLYYAEFDQDFEITLSGSGSVQTADQKFKFNLTNDYGNTLNISGRWSLQGTSLTLDSSVDGESLKLICEKI